MGVFADVMGLFEDDVADVGRFCEVTVALAEGRFCHVMGRFC